MFFVDVGLTIPEAGIVPSGRFRTRGKAKTAANLQDWRSLFNNAVMCLLINPTAPLLAGLLSAATGGPNDVDHWRRVGERSFHLKRAFNNRLGVRRGNDRLPERLFVPLANGTQGRRPNMEALLSDYYAWREWDWQTGKPRREKLLSLGLPEVAEDLWNGS
jgi:aldehyde:ferredoxin oxidoreductase